MMKQIKHLEVFTDGSCMKTKEKMKCGYGIYFPNGEIPNISRKFVYGDKTNQRAELFAIYVTLIIVKKMLSCKEITIYTDSMYSMKCITEWIPKWIQNNWKTSTGKNVMNQDILKPLYDIYKKIIPNTTIRFVHVPSHTGNKDFKSLGNDKADKLATLGSNRN